MFTTDYVDLTSLFSLSFASSSYVNQSAPGVRTPFSVDLTSLFSLTTFSTRTYQALVVPNFSRGRSLESIILGTGAVVRGTTAVELTWEVAGAVIPTVPTPSAGGYELLYPITPVYDPDVRLQQLDSRDWRRVQLSAPGSYDKLGYRIRRSSMDAFIAFLEANVGQLVELYTPGVRPFGESYVRSNVRVIDYQGWSVEGTNLFHLEVTYQLVLGVA